MLKLLATIFLFLAVPAIPQTTKRILIIPPVDAEARAKFPHEKPELIDQMAFVNGVVNGAMQPVSDRDHYKMADLWVMAPDDMKGDCEDYALTKIFMLQRNGWDVVSDVKLVGVRVKTIVGGKTEIDGHAILAVHLPNGSVLYMDQRYPEPMTRRELERDGYTFFDWKA